MENKHNFVVIVAGGVGSRFWPESRQHLPKQFLDIINVGSTLIQSTYDRISSLCPSENVFVVTHLAYKDLVLKQLPQVNEQNILVEPYRKNTAPAIAYVSYTIRNIDPEANIMITPADHLILNEIKFHQIVNDAFSIIDNNDILLTLGIQPTRPDTGYGYIQYNESKSIGICNKVKTFTEKPNLELARSFLKSGDFLWNSGMFFWNVQTIIKSFESYLPEMADLFERGLGTKTNAANQEIIIENIYSQCNNQSIDYGVMEKSDVVYVIPANFGWTDLGTWESIYNLYEPDNDANAVIRGKVKTYDTSNSFIKIPSNKLAIIQGLDHFIVIDTKDVLLICERGKEQEIKDYVNDIKDEFGDKFI